MVQDPIIPTETGPPAVGRLAAVFLHLGATAYGGLAMMEPMRRRVVQEKGWLSQPEFLDGLALCQMVPGATMVQLAAYVGYRLRKGAGALAAAGAFVLPAFLLMVGLTWLYSHWGELSWIKAVSRGFNTVVIALLLQAVWGLSPLIRRHWLDLTIALLSLAAFWFRLNYLLVFMAAGLLRLLLGWPRGLTQAAPENGANPGQVPAPGCTMRLVGSTAAALALGVMLLWQVNEQLGLMSWIFFKASLVAFGSGLGMLPILQWEMVDRLGWLTLREFLDGILLGFITPGPILITASFVGYRLQGLPGAAAATVSVFLPPVLLTILFTPFYQRVKESRWLRPVIQGILAALVGMLALLTVQMGLAALTDFKAVMLTVAAAVALLVLQVRLLWLVAAVAGISLVWF